MENTNNFNLLSLFNDKKLVKICAPMVRYSKFQFRTLVREYDCDLCFSPMILADSFCLSQKARDNELIINSVDQPLVVQFAANTVHDFVGAANLVSPYCNGVDLNCGCPQRWAKSMGVGCIMLERPELIYDIVRQCRNQIRKPFTVSVKMRILSNIRKSVDICQQLEHCGASFLTVHGRTAAQKTDNVNLEAMKIISDSVQCPVIANGGVKNLNEVLKLHEETNCHGVMVANGLLTNPALFSGCTQTPVECVQKWLDICINSIFDSVSRITSTKVQEKSKALTFQCFHHHLVFMLEKIMPKKDKKIFNNLTNFESVLEFLDIKLNVKPSICKNKYEKYKPTPTNYEQNIYKYLELYNKCDSLTSSLNYYNYEISDGKFFKTKITSDDVDDSDTFISELFV